MWKCYVGCVQMQWYEIVVEVVEQCWNDDEEYYQYVVIGDYYVLQMVVWCVFCVGVCNEMCFFQIYVLYVGMLQFYLYIDCEVD